jgi:hypothetical protein
MHGQNFPFHVDCWLHAWARWVFVNRHTTFFMNEDSNEITAYFAQKNPLLFTFRRRSR